MAHSRPTPHPPAQTFYDDVWSRYGELDAASPAAFHRRRLVLELASSAAPDARRILDVGCGQGELLRELAARFPHAQLSGGDLSEQSILDSGSKNPNVDVFVLDLLAAEFDQAHASKLGRYELVTCCEVIEHLPDDELAVQRLAALLEPGGALILTVPGGKMSRFDQVIGHQRHYRPDDLQRLLSGAGLETERVLAWGFPFHNAYRAAVRLASCLAIPEPAAARPEQSRSGSGVVSGALGQAYRLFGRALRPLFYLNVSRGGQQLVALARMMKR